MCRARTARGTAVPAQVEHALARGVRRASERAADGALCALSDTPRTVALQCGARAGWGAARSARKSAMARNVRQASCALGHVLRAVRVLAASRVLAQEP